MPEQPRSRGEWFAGVDCLDCGQAFDLATRDLKPYVCPACGSTNWLVNAEYERRTINV